MGDSGVSWETGTSLVADADFVCKVSLIILLRESRRSNMK